MHSKKYPQQEHRDSIRQHIDEPECSQEVTSGDERCEERRADPVNERRVSIWQLTTRELLRNVVVHHPVPTSARIVGYAVLAEEGRDVDQDEDSDCKQQFIGVMIIAGLFQHAFLLSAYGGANVTGQGTRHLVEGTLQPIVQLKVFLRFFI